MPLLSALPGPKITALTPLLLCLHNSASAVPSPLLRLDHLISPSPRPTPRLHGFASNTPPPDPPFDIIVLCHPRLHYPGLHCSAQTAAAGPQLLQCHCHTVSAILFATPLPPWLCRLVSATPTPPLCVGSLVSATLFSRPRPASTISASAAPQIHCRHTTIVTLILSLGCPCYAALAQPLQLCRLGFTTLAPLPWLCHLGSVLAFGAQPLGLRLFFPGSVALLLPLCNIVSTTSLPQICRHGLIATNPLSPLNPPPSSRLQSTTSAVPPSLLRLCCLSFPTLPLLSCLLGPATDAPLPLLCIQYPALDALYLASLSSPIYASTILAPVASRIN